MNLSLLACLALLMASFALASETETGRDCFDGKDDNDDQKTLTACANAVVVLIIVFWSMQVKTTMATESPTAKTKTALEIPGSGKNVEECMDIKGPARIQITPAPRQARKLQPACRACRLAC